MGSDATDATPSLEEVRWRLDAIDGELLKLLDERASLAGAAMVRCHTRSNFLSDAGGL